VGRDLLDDWTVAVRFGRIGQGGQERRYASPEPELMRRVIRDRLRRRLSAPRRIGCPYRLASFSSAPGFDAADWLPGGGDVAVFRGWVMYCSEEVAIRVFLTVRCACATLLPFVPAENTVFVTAASPQCHGLRQPLGHAPVIMTPLDDGGDLGLALGGVRGHAPT